MDNELRSPQIRHLSWGRMEVDGVGVGKDFKLWPGGAGSCFPTSSWGGERPPATGVMSVSQSLLVPCLAERTSFQYCLPNDLWTLILQFLA